MIKNLFHSLALEIENRLARTKEFQTGQDVLLERYIGYSTQHSLIVRGRTLLPHAPNLSNRLLSTFGNAGVIVKYFLTREISGVEVEVSGVKTCSDSEGYFDLEIRKSQFKSIPSKLTVVQTGDEYPISVSITSEEAKHGVISDIDDTIIQTGAWHFLRNVWTTLTKRTGQRVVFADTVALITKRQDGKNPVFYVSSSPWNLYQYLKEVFVVNGVPFGSFFLRDLGVDENKFIKSSHGAHKAQAIDAIIAANPDLTFTLIGDTGQHDAEVYLDAINRHPEHITEVCLRQAGKVHSCDSSKFEKIKQTDVKFYYGCDFWPLVCSAADHENIRD